MYEPVIGKHSSSYVLQSKENGKHNKIYTDCR